jgi:EAL domain-containing protein (putative c-di-GMP-specific phosphodiesterase class I)
MRPLQSVWKGILGISMSQILDELRKANPSGGKQGDEGKPELSMADLLNGMVNREFFFHHQPIIDLFTDQQIGSEMLIRWIRKGEVLAPMWFMPMIERHGLVTELDQYVMDRFSEIPWSETVKPDFKYRAFINISAQSFMEPDFISGVVKTTRDMQANDIIPVLELSERTACEIEFVKKQIANLHAFGVEIALDDFGIGFSSLSRLIEFPIDILKIDRSIINQIGQSTRAETIIQSIFQIAQDMQLTIVAEGVETENQANWLSTMKQCWVQGFYYARPTITGYRGGSTDRNQPVTQRKEGKG